MLAASPPLLRPMLNPIPQCGSLDAEPLAQFRQRDALAAIEHDGYVRHMRLLLLWSSPATIVGLVVSVAIDAVQRCSFWTFPHVSEKHFKRLPAVTNTNTLGPVIREFRSQRVLAPLLHRGPRIVGAALPVVPAVPVSRAVEFCRTSTRAKFTPPTRYSRGVDRECLPARRADYVEHRKLLAHRLVIPGMTMVCQQIKAGGKVLPGLTRRRAAEAELYRGRA